MAALLFPELMFNDNTTGLPLAAGTIETYSAGTSTPVVTYTDSVGNTSAGTILTLDADGRPNSGNGIWLGSTSTYKFIIKNSNGATVQTIDNIAAGGFTGSSSFITAVAEVGLTGSRVLTGSTSLPVTDGGSGTTMTLSRAALTGDVTAAVNSNATTIATNAVTTTAIADANVTLAKMANITTDSLIGRDTAGTGVPEVITLGTSLSMTGAQVLQRAALTGDVTAAVNSNATTIATNAVTTTAIADANVTLAKLANITTDSLIGRDTAGTGVPEVITLSSSLVMSGAQVLGLTSTLNLGSNTSFTIPQGTGPTVSSAGHIAVDTNTDNSAITQGSVVFHNGVAKHYVASADTLPTTTGQVLVYDGVAKKSKWATVAGGSVASKAEAFLTIGNTAGLTAERSIAVTNGIAATDGGAGASYTLNLDVTGLTVDSTPDFTADYIATYDTSASTNKKVLLSKLSGFNHATSGSTTFPHGVAGKWPTRSVSTSAVTINTVYFMPIIFEKTVTIDVIFCDVLILQAAKNVRIGIYASSATTGAPTGSVLAESSATSTATTGTKSLSTSQALTPNTIYWMAFNTDADTASFAAYTMANVMLPAVGAMSSSNTPTICYKKASAFGAFPTATGLTALSKIDSDVLPALFISVV